MKPAFDVHERLCAGDIIHHDNTVCASVVPERDHMTQAQWHQGLFIHHLNTMRALIWDQPPPLTPTQDKHEYKEQTRSTNTPCHFNSLEDIKKQNYTDAGVHGTTTALIYLKLCRSDDAYIPYQFNMYYK